MVPCPFGVDGDHDRLAPVSAGERRDELGMRERGGVEAHLVGSGVHGPGRIVLGAYSAAYGEGDEELASDGANRVGERPSTLEGGGDVENDQLVDSFAIVTTSELRRIAGAPKPLEIDPLDDQAVTDVEAGDDPLGEHVTR